MRTLATVLAMGGLVLAIAGTAQATSVQTDLQYTVTLSGGNWSTVYGYGGKYTGSRNWAESTVGGLHEITLPAGEPGQPGSASTKYAHAISSGTIAGNVPNPLVLGQTDHAHVWGINADNDRGWALGYSDGGAWWQAVNATPATVTFAYSYTLDGSQAGVDWKSSIEMFVQVWGGAGNLPQLSDQGWTLRPSDKVLTFADTLVGGPTSSKTVTGSAQWTFTPQAGQYYSIWAGGDAYAWDAVPEPITMAGMILGIGCLAGYMRKRRTCAGRTREPSDAEVVW